PMMSIWLVDKLFYLPFAWFVLQALMSIGWVNNIVARRTGLVQSLTALGISVRPVIGVAVQGPGVQPPGPAAPAAPQGEVRPFNLRRINPNRVVAELTLWIAFLISVIWTNHPVVYSLIVYGGVRLARILGPVAYRWWRDHRGGPTLPPSITPTGPPTGPAEGAGGAAIAAPEKAAEIQRILNGFKSLIDQINADESPEKSKFGTYSKSFKKLSKAYAKLIKKEIPAESRAELDKAAAEARNMLKALELYLGYS